MPTFGRSPADVVTNAAGDVQATTLTLYASEANATAQTSPLTTVTVTGGRWSYTHPTLRTVWARATDGTVWAINAAPTGVVTTIYNVVADYGADPTGVTDSTAAFQACIDAILGGSSDYTGGAIAGRLAKGEMFIPAGQYKITASLKIYGAIGFHMYGTGEETVLALGATITGPVVDIDGSYFGLYEKFTVIGAATTYTCSAAVSSDWTPTKTSRSATSNKFARINVRNLKYVNGIALGVNTGTNQMDNCTIDHCSVEGTGWTTAETTYWQAGFAVGSGGWGNVLNFAFLGCVASYNKYNYKANAITGFNVFGGSVGQSDAAFWLNIGNTAQIVGVRVEQASRLCDTSSNAGVTNASFRDVSYSATAGVAAPDNLMILWGYPGTLILDNVTFANDMAAPVIQARASSATPLAVLVRGGSSRQVPKAYVTSIGVNAPISATFEGYAQSNADGTVAKVFTHCVLTRAGVLENAPSVVTVTTSYTASEYDHTVITNGATVTVTLPDPTTVAPGFTMRVKNVNAAAATVNSAGTSKTIDGAASKSLAQWVGGRYVSDGTQWLTT